MVTPWMYEESKKYIIYPEMEISGWALKKGNLPGFYDFRYPAFYIRNVKLSKTEIQKIKTFSNFIATLTKRR